MPAKPDNASGANVERIEHVELPILGGIGTGLRWLEELIALVSGPMLTAGLAIALVDLFTDGKLLASEPALLYAWAISQALGVDGQLVGAAVKSGRALRANRWGLAVAYWPLIGALGYVAYLAANVFATQQALGLSTQEALARLGMDSTSWITARTIIAVVLVVISGLLRYDPVKQAEEDDTTRQKRLQREEEDAAHKARMRALHAGGFGAAIRAATSAARHGTLPVDTTASTSDTFPATSAASGFGEAAPPSRPLGGKRAGGSGANGAPAGTWIWSDLQQYVRAKFGLELTEEAAKEHMRSVPTADRLLGVTGRPNGAPRGDVKRWADGRFTAKVAAQMAAEEAAV
jgi:hypothetical protein